ncbi:MAG: peptidyl-prolyl cis-trans isomerase, partial [Deltaproteobacteria bacterium]
MLDILRRHADSWIIKVLLVGVALSFIIGFGAFFYIKDLIGKGRGRKPAIVVNGEAISTARIQNALRNLEYQYQQIFGENYDPETFRDQLRRQAIDQLIDYTILRQEAERKDIPVSDEELKRKIHEYPVFQTNGKFDIEKFKRFFGQRRGRSGLTQKRFLEEERQQLRVEKLRRMILDSVKVSDAEVEEAYRLKNEQVNLLYVAFDPKDETGEISFTEEELEAFFNQDPSAFQLPERRRISYVVFDASRYLDGIEISPEQIAAFYEENRDRFRVEEEIHARHILVKSSPDASAAEDEAARKKAEALLAKIRQGADFASVARENSDDLSNRDKGGDLGFFGRGRMVPPFEDAAFALLPGEVSDVVKTRFGYHIIKLEEKREARQKSLEEVSDEIAAELKAEEARKRAEAAAKAFAEALQNPEDFEKVAQQQGLEVETTPLFARGDPIEGLDRPWALISEVFRLEKGGVTEPVRAGERFVVARLDEIASPKTPTFEEVREKVIARFKKEKRKERAKARAEAFLAELKGGAAWDDLVTREHLEVEETGWFN